MLYAHLLVHGNSLVEELLNLRSYLCRVSNGISMSGHVQNFNCYHELSIYSVG